MTPDGGGTEKVKLLSWCGELLRVLCGSEAEGGGRGGLIFNDEGMDCAHATNRTFFDLKPLFWARGALEDLCFDCLFV